MGGIAGIIHHVGDPPDERILARMMQAIAHRSGETHQVHIERGAALGQGISPPTAAITREPYIDDDHVILLNGWVHFEDDEYWRRTDRPRPTTRAELLMHAWQRWGLDFTQHVDGDFAATIWDRQREILHLVRDRHGVKPLFWARSHGRLAFASELSSLLHVPWVSRNLARENLSEYLSFRVVHAPRTLLQDVHQIEPAQWLRFTRDAVRTQTYWIPPYAHPEAPRPRESEVLPALEDTIERAVRKRLPSGMQAGVYLSGGLGSAAITASAKDAYLKLRSFTVSFADDPYPESPIAGRVARLLGMEHREVVVGTPELADTFEAAVHALGHPVCSPTAILQFHLAQVTREHVKVVLTGDGSDELFGGRMLDRPAQRLRRARLVARLPKAVRWMTGALGTPLEGFGLSLGEGGTRLFSPSQRRHLLLNERLVRPRVRQEVLSAFYDPLHTDPINAMLYAWSRSRLAEETLVRADRTAARAGLDIRFPLLDREVVRLLTGLPGRFKLWRAGGALHTRWPLRAMLGGVLPQALLNRPDRGMPVPLDAWLSGPGRLFMEHRFARLARDSYQLWSPQQLRELKSSVGKEAGAGLQLWSLFILDAWLDSLSPSARSIG